MRKLIIPALALFILASCSNDEKGLVNRGEVNTNYLSVNLVTNFAGTRATDEDDFLQGTNDENRVNSVRFYFFNASGGAADVKRTTGDNFVNYYDWTPSGDVNNFGEQENNNVTNVISATLVIESPSDGSKDKTDAASLIAIVNPTASLLAKTASMDKATLLSEAESYTSYTFDSTGKGKFVMSNSVYSDEAASSPEKIIEVATDGHYYPTPDAAKGNPVTIYVERVLAKVQLTSDDETLKPVPVIVDGKTINLYDTGETYQDNSGATQKIYVKFVNWDVTTTPDKSNLVKNIDPAWSPTLFGAADIWNEPSRHRSYWAVNPSGINYDFLTYNDVTQTENVIFGEANVRYPHENAGNIDDSNYRPSQVIIGAQLVKADGTPLTIMKYGFDSYLNQTDLKKALLALVTTKYYVETSSEGTETAGGKNYRQIGVDDVEFVTDGSLLSSSSTDLKDKTCYTRLQLKKAGTGEPAVKYYTISGTGNSKVATEVSSSIINNTLLALGRQKIWEGGNTYYYFDIHHIGYLADGTRRTGVVRNHIYLVKIKTLVGLGTPVYDPEEEIIPQKPEGDDTYMAAEIKVLSWRLVNDEVDLKW